MNFYKYYKSSQRKKKKKKGRHKLTRSRWIQVSLINKPGTNQGTVVCFKLINRCDDNRGLLPWNSFSTFGCTISYSVHLSYFELRFSSPGKSPGNRSHFYRFWDRNQSRKGIKERSGRTGLMNLRFSFCPIGSWKRLTSFFFRGSSSKKAGTDFKIVQSTFR